MEYEIKRHSAYVSIWLDGQRIAKVPIQDSRYGLLANQALAMAQRIVSGLDQANGGLKMIPETDQEQADFDLRRQVENLKEELMITTHAANERMGQIGGLRRELYELRRVCGNWMMRASECEMECRELRRQLAVKDAALAEVVKDAARNPAG